jgi:Polysaccharide lyase
MTARFLSRPPGHRVSRRLLWTLLTVMAGSITLSLALTAHAAARPRSQPNRLLFNGGFTRRTFRPWSNLNLGENEQPLPQTTRANASLPIRIVHGPWLQRGLWAARFTVTPQRYFLEGTTAMERSEVDASLAQTGAYAGHSAWYGWAAYFPRGFEATPHHDTVTAQVHSVSSVCLPPNLYVAVNTQPAVASDSILDAISLITYGGPVNETETAPLTGCAGSIQEHIFAIARYQAHHWYRFVMHVMWSGNPSVGYVELWVNGRLAVPLTHVPTLYSSIPAYWKQGLYEFASPDAATDYELGVRVGSSYAAVAY